MSSASNFQTLARLLTEYPQDLELAQLRRLLTAVSALNLNVAHVSHHDSGGAIDVSYYQEVGRHDLAYIFYADGTCECLLEERRGSVGSWRDGIERILRDLRQSEQALAVSAANKAQQLDGLLSACHCDGQATTASQSLAASA